MHFVDFQPLSGSSKVELPSVPQKNNGIINMNNKYDQQCFKWAVARALNSISEEAFRITPKLR